MNQYYFTGDHFWYLEKEEALQPTICNYLSLAKCCKAN